MLGHQLLLGRGRPFPEEGARLLVVLVVPRLDPHDRVVIDTEQGRK